MNSVTEDLSDKICDSVDRIIKHDVRSGVSYTVWDTPYVLSSDHIWTQVDQRIKFQISDEL